MWDPIEHVIPTESSRQHGSMLRHVCVAGFLFAAPMGAYFVWHYWNRGPLSVGLLLWIAVCVAVFGAVFGVGAWYLWFKRHPL